VFCTENRSVCPPPEAGHLRPQVGSKDGPAWSLKIETAVPARTSDHHGASQRNRFVHRQTVASRSTLYSLARLWQGSCDRFKRDLAVAAHTSELKSRGVAIDSQALDAGSLEHLLRPVFDRPQVVRSSELEPDPCPVPTTGRQAGLEPDLADPELVVEVERLGEERQVQATAAEGRLDYQGLVNGNRSIEEKAPLNESQDVAPVVDQRLDQDRAAVVRRGAAFARGWIQCGPGQGERVPDLAKGVLVDGITDIDVTTKHVNAPKELFAERLATPPLDFNLSVNRSTPAAGSARSRHRVDCRTWVGLTHRIQKGGA